MSEAKDRTPTERELLAVSKHIGSSFQLVGVNLGLSSIKIQQIIMNHTNNVQTQIFQMLVAWKNKEGRLATVQRLLQAVRETTGDVDIVEIERVFNL
jgi:Tfp pilus assembly ATPase PilU